MVMITIIQLDDIASKMFKTKETWLFLLLCYIIANHHMHSLVFTL